MRLPRILSLLLVFAALAGCGSDVSVSSIQLGRSINADETVANHTTVFEPHQTIYVSVGTTGVGSAELGVRWIYAGRVMGEPKKPVKGARATEFHMQSAGGFPLGDYSVEVFLNGQAVGNKTFKVENPR